MATIPRNQQKKGRECSMAKLDPTTAPVDSVTTPVARRFVLPEGLRNFGQTYGGLTVLLLIILYDILFRPHFLQVQSLYNDLQEVAPIAIIATGMTLVIATGGIDLSVGSLMAFAGALAAIIFLSPVLATGGNEAAARLAGIPVNRVKLAVYTISAMLAALAGFIIIAINSSSDATRVGLNGELDAIAAVAVGGTPLTGGQANVAGTLIGALIIYLIGATLVSQNVSFGAAQMIKPVIILVAVFFPRP